MQQMLDSEQQETTLKVLTGETYDSLSRANLEKIIDHLNYLRGKNEGTIFVTLKQQQPSSCRTIQFIKDRKNVCLTSDQVRVYL